jgi:hypothetical protein
MVTSARRAPGSRRGSSRWTFPSSSITASTVRIMIQLTGLSVRDSATPAYAQGGDDVEAGHRQEQRLLGSHPPGARGPLAPGAVSVAAGVVRDALGSAVFTLLHMAPERSGAAAGDGAQDPALLQRGRVGAQKAGAVGAHHLFKGRPFS